VRERACERALGWRWSAGAGAGRRGSRRAAPSCSDGAEGAAGAGERRERRRRTLARGAWALAERAGAWMRVAAQERAEAGGTGTGGPSERWRAGAGGAAGERGDVQAEEGRLRHMGGAGQGRMRYRRKQMALMCSKAGASAGPATGEGGVAVQGNDVQSDDVQGGDVQRMAVSPLGELRPRPSWCAGRSRAVREELQCGGCGRIRTGAPGPRVENDGARRGEGSGRRSPDANRPRPSRRWRGGYGAAVLQEATRVCRPCFCSTRA
jgi:hypothetical protein